MESSGRPEVVVGDVVKNLAGGARVETVTIEAEYVGQIHLGAGK